MNVPDFSEGEKVKWMSIQCLQVRKTTPSKLYFKYSVGLQPDVAFSCIDLAKWVCSLHHIWQKKLPISHQSSTVDASVSTATNSLSRVSSWHQAALEICPTSPSWLLRGYHFTDFCGNCNSACLWRWNSKLSSICYGIYVHWLEFFQKLARQRCCRWRRSNC